MGRNTDTGAESTSAGYWGEAADLKHPRLMLASRVLKSLQRKLFHNFILIFGKLLPNVQLKSLLVIKLALQQCPQ